MTGQEREALIEAMRVGSLGGSMGEIVWLAARDYFSEHNYADARGKQIAAGLTANELLSSVLGSDDEEKHERA